MTHYRAVGAGQKYGFEKTTGLVIQQGIFEISEEPKHQIGTCMKLVDGRKFMYARAGASALSKGLLNFAVQTVGGHERVAVVADVAVWDKAITLTMITADVTADQYAEGYISVRDTAGVGQLKKIYKHGAGTAPADIEFIVYDPFTEAVTTSDFCDVIKNCSDGVIESATSTQVPSGVPLVDVTADYYFWNQCGGPASVLADGAIALGTTVAPGAVAGSVKTQIAFTDPIVGTAAILSINTEYMIVNLNIT